MTWSLDVAQLALGCLMALVGLWGLLDIDSYMWENWGSRPDYVEQRFLCGGVKLGLALGALGTIFLLSFLAPA